MDELIRRRKLDSIAAAEAVGNVADSMKYRTALLARVKAGKISLEEAQAQLKSTKRKASSIGKTTQSKLWRQS